MAAAVSHPREELTGRISAIKEAANATQGLPVVRIEGQPKSARDLFVAPCLYGASHSGVPYLQFLHGCFPATGLEHALGAIDAKLKAAAFETDGDPEKAKAFQGNIIFVARDDQSARDVESNVKDVVADWKAHLQENDDKLIVESRQLALTTAQKKFASVADDYFNALKGAKVARKGRTVRVSFREALSKDDLLAFEDADRASAAKRRATADILEAISAKQPVPQGALGRLVGPRWATFLTGPAPIERPPSPSLPMSNDECRKLQARLAPFSSASFSTTEARLMFVSHKFASCAVHPPQVDDVQRACLASFTSADDYARCATPDIGRPLPTGQPPESEFGDR
jgi:hypothetical protein